MVFLNQNEFLKQKSYWEGLAPNLHIQDKIFLTNSREDQKLAPEQKDLIQERIKTEGYYQAESYFAKAKIEEINQLTQRLVAANILPVFSYIYDETWLLMLHAKPIIESVLGQGYKLRPCIWTWHLNPQKEESGWKPHRDGLQNSVNKDGSPNLLTVWIALSEATPLNGCMYIVPMDRSGKAHETQDAKNFDFELPSLRALPAKAGDLFMWNHWVIHWGSRASKHASEPRISMAFELERDGSNINKMPLINPTQIPSFEARLKLIAFQIQQYTHMYKFSSQMLNFSKEILSNAVARSAS